MSVNAVRMRKETSPAPSTGPIYNKDGSIAVDQKKYPVLYRAAQRGLAWREEWARVVELRKIGEDERLAGRLLA